MTNKRFHNKGLKHETVCFDHTFASQVLVVNVLLINVAIKTVKVKDQYLIQLLLKILQGANCRPKIKTISISSKSGQKRVLLIKYAVFNRTLNWSDSFRLKNPEQLTYQVPMIKII